MAGVVMDEKDLDKLENIGVKDSKLLTPLQREAMFDRIKLAVTKFEIIILSPQDVDDALNSKEINLNWLEAINSAKIINILKPNKAILDCPSTNIEAYKNYVENLVTSKTKIISEHKADLNYKIVGAASILAKVTRDREIERLKHNIKKDFGSGYPSDPKTIAFLRDNWEKYPKLFRKTWSSYKKHSEAKNQQDLSNF